ESFAPIRLPVVSNRSTSESNNTLPVVMEEEPTFDWDSIA
ncbi:unnamed protein product, partial [Rotaria magnacalcarata]